MEISSLKTMARTLLFEIDEQVLADFQHLFDDIMVQIAAMKKINTDNYQPMTRVGKPITLTLDFHQSPSEIVQVGLTIEQVLSNATSHEQNYITLPKRKDYHEN